MNTAEDIKVSTNQAKSFTKLDLCKGYWQIPMCKADLEKNAFITQDGHYPIKYYSSVSGGLRETKAAI